jgi:putative mRNA 3-end processing factor
VDWPALLGAIEATGAQSVWVTHGYREQVVRYLVEKGLDARSIASHWEGENDEQPVVADDADEATIA